jgi:ribosomal protein S18 acetylase RimI-like enzyme
MAPTFRRGTIEDSYTVYTVFVRSLEDFIRRTNVQTDQTAGDLEAWWARRRPLFEHLARTADQFWIAEEAGAAIGYARSILRDETRELTEFFVLPASQSVGVGRELLARAFPAEGVSHRSIIATSDSRAQGRYLRAGVYAHFPIYYFCRKPQVAPEPPDLTMEPFGEAGQVMAELRAIDREILGYTRDIDHEWLSQERQGYLYRRGGRVVGYGYAGLNNSPFALLDGNDFPAVLAHAEAQAAEQGLEETGFEVPLINKQAVDYLLRRGYRMDAFLSIAETSDKRCSRLPMTLTRTYITFSPSSTASRADTSSQAR